MTKRYNWINTETGIYEYASPVELTKKYQLCKPCMKALAKGFSRKKHYKHWRIINDNQQPDTADIFGVLGSETRAIQAPRTLVTQARSGEDIVRTERKRSELRDK